MTAVISLGLALNIFSAYVINESYTKSYFLIIAVILLVNLLMYVLGYSKRTMYIGIIGWAAFIVGWIIFLRSKGWLTFDEKVDTSFAAFWSILLLTPALVYLVTRNRKVLLAAAPIGTLVLAAFRFLEYPVSTVGMFLVIGGLALEVLYKVYMDSLLNASYGNFRIRHFLEQSIAVVAVVGVLSAGIFYGIIRPTDPPTRKLQLIKKLMSFQVIEQIGVAWNQIVEGSNTSDKTNDEEKDTQNKEEKDKDNKNQNNDDQQKQQQDQNETKESDEKIKAHAITYETKDYTAVWAALLVLLLLALPFAIKYFFRYRRKRRIAELSPKEGSVFLYKFFLKEFKLLKMGKTDGQTVLEYADMKETALRSFDTPEGTTFAELSDVYNKILYAGYDPTAEEYAKFCAFYKSFYKNARRKLGKLKYVFAFWAL